MTPLDYALDTHLAKGKVYDNTWRQRGELFSILPNIDRKVNRLGRAGAGDTELDTRLDLVVYLGMYSTWLMAKAVREYEPMSKTMFWEFPAFRDMMRDHAPGDAEPVSHILTLVANRSHIEPDNEDVLIAEVRVCVEATWSYALRALTRDPLDSEDPYIDDRFSFIAGRALPAAWKLYAGLHTQARE